ncbi:hypothetical protein ACFWDG_06030 [Peribacillus sp. NPDC060186]
MKNILKVLSGIAIVLSLAACGDEDNTAEPVKAEPKIVEAKPKPSIDKVELISEEVKPILKKRIADVDKVEIKDGAVKVSFSADKTYWDETDIVSSTARQGLPLMEMLFKNKDVKTVEIVAPTNMLDDKGNEEVSEVVKVKWDRATSEEINYENFGDMLYADFTRFYNESDSYFIHPGVFGKIKEKHLVNFENGAIKQ